VIGCIGFADTGRLITDAGVDKVAFTGSVRSGQAVAAQCATTLTPASLELDDAARYISWVPPRSSGLGCISLEVAYVVESVHDSFAEKLKAVASTVRVGSDHGADIGPVPLPAQILIIRQHIEDAISRGATVVLGGADAIVDGRYVKPTIQDHVPNDSLAATVETFGPALAIVTVRAGSCRAAPWAGAGAGGSPPNAEMLSGGLGHGLDERVSPDCAVGPWLRDAGVEPFWVRRGLR
jgi:aldehyde dehydrogenase (NAD+)